ncbi:hypothetical protein [Ruegeria marina]|uniref:Uncharacterized protein n=1 Tax=Ruegeria marina TaxID=639004 RepID=A0A1G7D8A9_9RHOB|nr:hypothetical protein [Ruegeria marina]SDE47874.1 hypothetical protein SAMN04488239_12054 [Ruegeria marina]
MDYETEVALYRLERAAALIQNCIEHDAFDQLEVDEYIRWRADRAEHDAIRDDWEAIDCLITVALQGRPNRLSYMDEEWEAFAFGTPFVPEDEDDPEHDE